MTDALPCFPGTFYHYFSTDKLLRLPFYSNGPMGLGKAPEENGRLRKAFPSYPTRYVYNCLLLGVLSGQSKYLAKRLQWKNSIRFFSEK